MGRGRRRDRKDPELNRRLGKGGSKLERPLLRGQR